MVSLRRKATRCEMIAPCIGNRKSLNEFNKNRIELPQRRVSRGAIPGFGARTLAYNLRRFGTPGLNGLRNPRELRLAAARSDDRQLLAQSGRFTQTEHRG